MNAKSFDTVASMTSRGEPLDDDKINDLGGDENILTPSFFLSEGGDLVPSGGDGGVHR